MTAIPDDSLAAPRPAPRNRNVIVFSIAQCASFTGAWGQKTAVGWLTWELTQSPAWVGAVALSDLIAAFWVAPLAGAVADRSNPYRLIWLTQTLTVVNCCVLWFLVAAGLVSPWPLLAWAVADATFQGFNQPVRMMVTGTLAPEGRVSQAIAANSIAVNVARTAGPAIAGLLIVRSGIESVFLFNALSFAVVFAALLHVRRWIDHPPPAVRAARLSGDVLAGFRYIRTEPPIAMLFVLTLSFSLLARPFTELFPALAGGSFGGGPQMLAMLMSAQGLGAFVGASWMLRRQSTPALARTSYAAALGIAAALVVFALAQSALFALPAIAVAGLFHVVCNIAMQSMAQSLSLAAMRGRVLALYTLVFRAAPALGAFVLGWLAEWFDLQTMIGIAAGLFAMIVCAALPAARRIYLGKPASNRQGPPG
ncbi:MFS transporter [Shinella pollutisoli]|uniref:MFS transporter n=1 Tax=Shinella pollutisoli TaxID=2250594 RepID=A0ABV7DLI8_9HYPH|nr:MFS transporter [Shinella pollutisoli]